MASFFPDSKSFILLSLEWDIIAKMSVWKPAKWYIKGLLILNVYTFHGFRHKIQLAINVAHLCPAAAQRGASPGGSISQHQAPVLPHTEVLLYLCGETIQTVPEEYSILCNAWQYLDILLYEGTSGGSNIIKIKYWIMTWPYIRFLFNLFFL